MSTTKRPIETLDLSVNDTTKVPEIERAVVALAALISDGKIPVNASDVTLAVDAIDADIAALVAGISGAVGSAKTLADVVTALSSMTPPTAAAVAAAVANPDSLTFTRVKIDQTAGAGQTVLIAADGTKVMRLHRLYVRMALAGDLTIEEAAGTDLSGPMPVPATGIVDLKFEPSKNGAHAVTAASAGLAILTTQKVYGFAIVSSNAN